MSSVATDGVLIVRERDHGGGGRGLGIEPISGALLWETDLAADDDWVTPVAGEGRVAFLNNDYGQPTQALLADVFTGRIGTRLELPEYLGAQGPTRAFFAEGSLLVSGFLEETLYAFDPDDGRERFRVEAGPGRDLSTVLLHRAPGRSASCALLFTPSALGGGKSGELIGVDLRNGFTSSLARVEPGDEVIGIRFESVTHLASPFAFLVAGVPGARRTPIEAIHLDRGRAWKNELAVSTDELWRYRWSAPVVSETVAAVVFGAKEPGSGRRRLLKLVFYDLESGYQLDSRLLPGDFDDFARMTLDGLGESLWIGSITGTGSNDQIQVWK